MIGVCVCVCVCVCVRVRVCVYLQVKFLWIVTEKPLCHNKSYTPDQAVEQSRVTQLNANTSLL